MSNAVEAIGCRVVLRVQKVEDFDPVFKKAKNAGLVFADDHEDAKRKQAGIDKGVVLELGPHCDPAYVEGIKVGDTVGFAKYAGKIVASLDDSEDKYLVLNDDDLICKFRSRHG